MEKGLFFQDPAPDTDLGESTSKQPFFKNAIVEQSLHSMNDFLVPKPESLGHPSEDGKNNYSDSDSQRFEDDQVPNNGRR